MQLSTELIKIAKDLLAANSNLTIIKVEDTRDYIEEDDRWIPIPGSGISNTCQFCGSKHEVHVTVADKETHQTFIVGTSCAKKMGVPDTELKKAQKVLTEKLTKDEVAARDKVIDDIIKQVKHMVPPETSMEPMSSGAAWLKMGDAKVLCPRADCNEERHKTLKQSWYNNRATELIPKNWQKNPKLSLALHNAVWHLSK